MDATVRVTLPHGHWVNEAHHRGVELRPLDGRDHEYLSEAGGDWLAVERNTALLSRCITRMDGMENVTWAAVEGLTVGDREALLLQLRRLTLGERLQCVLNCPAAECGEKMDLDLETERFLLEPYEEPRLWHETIVEDSGRPLRTRFRLPTGSDQTEGAQLARSDPQAGMERILRRCVASVTTDSGEPVTDWPSSLLTALSGEMSERDPQAELILNLTCPYCGHVFSALLDAGAFFHREIAQGADRLYREVHLLAFHYHWSESEIMGMPQRKRQRYLNLLVDALSEGSRL